MAKAAPLWIESIEIMMSKTGTNDEERWENKVILLALKQV
ncbi:hypothetical protein Q7O_000009 [Pectobacterium carotovorum subsp. carotovorum PCCS1]|nr:hypothetical protein [Pectobacterium carotovorum subsp. carotovorum PCCS1]